MRIVGACEPIGSHQSSVRACRGAAALPPDGGEQSGPWPVGSIDQPCLVRHLRFLFPQVPWFNPASALAPSRSTRLPQPCGARAPWRPCLALPCWLAWRTARAAAGTAAWPQAQPTQAAACPTSCPTSKGAWQGGAEAVSGSQIICHMTMVDHLACSSAPLPASSRSYFPCSPNVKVGRPKSVEELAALVAKWPKVKVRHLITASRSAACWPSPC